MNNEEIITNIKSIYAKYPITSLLRNHMLNVAAIGSMICDNWKGPAINKTDVVAYLLLHDLGNLVKFDMVWSKENDPEIKADFEHWEKLQEETIAKYGDDDEQVTVEFAKEIGVSERILELLRNNEFINIKNIISKDDYAQKIGKYSDLRVTPKGVVPLLDRIKEFKKRYEHRKDIRA